MVQPTAALAALEAVVLDCETTGLDVRSARVVQLGAVRIVAGGVRHEDVFERLVDPGIPIPKASSAVHGLADAHVKGQSTFPEAAAALAGYVGGRLVIGHAISYDLAVLEREHARAKLPWQRPVTLDTRLLGRIAAPFLAEHDLERLCSLLGVTLTGRHTAVGDARATAEVFVKLVPLLREHGIRTVAEAVAASAAMTERERQAGGRIATPERPAAPPLTRLDPFVYRHRVADVMSAPARFLLGNATVGAAARLMLADGLSSVFVKLDGGLEGIVTERDALRALASGGAQSASTPLAEVAKRPLLGVEADDHVYRAIGRMERLGMRHLAVRRGGETVGALTPRNLLRNRATSTIMIGDGVAAAATPGDLAARFAEVSAMAAALLADGLDARAIAAVVSGIIADITGRAAELATAEMERSGRGGPPVAYALLVLGSAGRGESLLAADQDNAIVYERGDPGGPEDQWFEAMATRMCAILDQAGIVFCKGGVMAKTAAWRQSRAGWEATIATWLTRQRPVDLLNVDIFFDAVTVHGDRALGDGLLADAHAAAGRSRDFMMMLTELARRWSSPVTLFGGIRKTDGRTDLKLHGLLPLVTGARVLALRHAISARATAERLRAVALRDAARAAAVEKAVAAHEVLLRSVLAQQLTDGRNGVRLSPRVDVDRLDAVARRDLVAALKAVPLVIDMVAEGRL